MRFKALRFAFQATKVKTVEEMQGKAEDQLSDLRKKEMADAHDFEMLEGGLTLGPLAVVSLYMLSKLSHLILVGTAAGLLTTYATQTSGAGGGLLQCFNSLRTWMHRRSLGFSKPGESMGRTFASASRAGRARSRPAAAFAHRSQQGSLHHGRRSRALVFNPGALEARSGCGAWTQKVRGLSQP